MTEDDVVALNDCKPDGVVTIWDGTRIQKLQGRGECLDCAVWPYNERCNAVKCDGFIFRVEVKPLSKKDAGVLSGMRPNDLIVLNDGRRIRCLDSNASSICQHCAMRQDCNLHNEKGIKIKCGSSRFFVEVRETP